jgi:hypothetical protein
MGCRDLRPGVVEQQEADADQLSHLNGRVVRHTLSSLKCESVGGSSAKKLSLPQSWSSFEIQVLRYDRLPSQEQVRPSCVIHEPKVQIVTTLLEISHEDAIATTLLPRAQNGERCAPVDENVRLIIGIDQEDVHPLRCDIHTGGERSTEMATAGERGRAPAVGDVSHRPARIEWVVIVALAVDLLREVEIIEDLHSPLMCPARDVPRLSPAGRPQSSAGRVCGDRFGTRFPRVEAYGHSEHDHHQCGNASSGPGWPPAKATRSASELQPLAPERRALRTLARTLPQAFGSGLEAEYPQP